MAHGASRAGTVKTGAAARTTPRTTRPSASWTRTRASMRAAARPSTPTPWPTRPAEPQSTRQRRTSASPSTAAAGAPSGRQPGGRRAARALPGACSTDTLNSTSNRPAPTSRRSSSAGASGCARATAATSRTSHPNRRGRQGPWRSWRSILVPRRPLLLAGTDRLLQVLRRQAHQQLVAVLEVDGGGEAAGLEVRPEQLLGHRHAVRAPTADLLGEVEGDV